MDDEADLVGFFVYSLLESQQVVGLLDGLSFKGKGQSFLTVGQVDLLFL